MSVFTAYVLVQATVSLVLFALWLSATVQRNRAREQARAWQALADWQSCHAVNVSEKQSSG